jgi:hypothetical protein
MFSSVSVCVLSVGLVGLHVCLFACICLYVSVSLSLSLCISLCLPAYFSCLSFFFGSVYTSALFSSVASAYLPLSVHVCASVPVLLSPSVFLSVCLSVCLFESVRFGLSVCLCVCRLSFPTFFEGMNGHSHRNPYLPDRDTTKMVEPKPKRRSLFKRLSSKKTSSGVDKDAPDPVKKMEDTVEVKKLSPSLLGS